jgi:hypothetical protein
VEYVRPIQTGIALPVQRGFATSIAERLRLSIFEDAIERDVILMILADTGEMLNDLNPMLL